MMRKIILMAVLALAAGCSSSATQAAPTTTTSTTEAKPSTTVPESPVPAGCAPAEQSVVDQINRDLFSDRRVGQAFRARGQLDFTVGNVFAQDGTVSVTGAVWAVRDGKLYALSSSLDPISSSYTADDLPFAPDFADPAIQAAQACSLSSSQLANTGTTIGP